MNSIYEWLLEKFSWSPPLASNATTTTNGSVDVMATTTYRNFYKPININAYRHGSGHADGTGGGNYYIAGVLFMVSVIGLLLYVNLYYENCFRDTCFRLSKYRVCSFLRHFFVKVSRTPRHSSSSQTRSSLKKQQTGSNGVAKKKTGDVNEVEANLIKDKSKVDDSRNDCVYKVYIWNHRLDREKERGDELALSNTVNLFLFCFKINTHILNWLPWN